MFSRLFCFSAVLGLTVLAFTPGFARQTLSATADDTCGPWSRPAVTVTAPLPAGPVFIARAWRPESLPGGLEIDNESSNGNASVCDDPEKTEFMDCRPVDIRIQIIDAKDGDTGAGTLYIEGMGTFILNVRWNHTPRFCG